MSSARAGCSCESLEPRILLAAELVGDINLTTPDGFPVPGIVFQGEYNFPAEDEQGFPQLWRTDGTAAGTTAWDTLRPSPGPPAQFAATDQRLLFVTGRLNGAGGLGLWSSDGTAASTSQIGGVVKAGVTPDQPGFDLINVGGTFFFPSRSGIHYQLWKTDGTPGGTVLVQNDLNAEITPQEACAVGGTLYFTAIANSTYGIWKTDGTAAGTVLLKPTTIRPQMAAANGTIFFSGYDPKGFRLWSTDGTTAGTVGLTNLFPYQMVAAGGMLFFITSPQVGRVELWKSDGTPQGTVRVQTISTSGSPSGVRNMVAVGGNVYFYADDGIHGSELWRSDGTADGTFMVRDINAGPAGSIPLTGPYQLSGPPVAGPDGKVYFVANDGIHGPELWKSDGTPDGTLPVADLNPGPLGSNPTSLAWAEGRLFFAASVPGTGTDLYATDGTESGTAVVHDFRMKTADAFATDSSGSDVTAPAAVLNNGTLVFPADDGFHGTEPWASDGTDAGTVLLGDVNPNAASSSPHELTSTGRLVFFAATDSDGIELWKTDGTAAGTAVVKAFAAATAVAGPHDLLSLNGTLLFWLTVSDASGVSLQLWRSDGTSDGTILLRTFSRDAVVGPSVVFGGMLVFSEGGLWRTDGTIDGTQPIGGADATTPFATLNGSLYYVSAGLGDANGTVWTSDGTAAGTRSLNLTAREVAAAGTHLFYHIYDTRTGSSTLYAEDEGSPPVTLGVFPNLSHLSMFEGSLLFSANGIGYRSDGTEAGTVPDPAALGQAVSFGNELYFSDGQNLLRTDGTDQGLEVVEPAGDPSDLLLVGSTLYYRSSDGSRGRELWRLDGLPPEPRPHAQVDGPFPVGEGGSVRLAGTGSFGSVYEWDFNYDGNPADFYVDATGADPLFSAGPLDGPSSHVVAMRVTRDGQTSDIATGVVNVFDVPPDAQAVGDASANAGQGYTLHLSYHDPGSDTPLSWTIDWGDGSVIPYPGSTTDVTHAYGAGGRRYPLAATITDQDGPHRVFVQTPVQLDPTFGAGGTVTTPLSSDVGNLPSAVVRADGAIILAIQHSATECQLVEYDSLGQQNRSYGTGGVAAISFPAVTRFATQSIAAMPDGGIIVSGEVQSAAGSDWAFARLTADGSLDLSFGDGGKAVIDLGTPSERVDAIAVQPDGKVVVVGSPGTNAPVVVARLNADGRLDSSFNGFGTLSLGPANQTTYLLSADLCALDQDGNILVVGHAGAAPDLGIDRIKPNGQLDMAFGEQGLARPDVGFSRAVALAVALDNSILLTGWDSAPDANNNILYVWHVVRLTSDARLDPSFNGGKSAPVPLDPSYNGVTGLVLQPDGRILIAGQSAPRPGAGTVPALARFNPDGTPDRTLNGTGILVASAAPPQDLSDVALSPNDQLVTVGAVLAGSITAVINRFVLDGVEVVAPPLVSGSVFADANHNGLADPGESGLAWATVYLDLNGNGHLDSGEPSAVSDASGRYTLLPELSGTFSVRIVDPAGYRRTAPLPAASDVTIAFGPATAVGPVLGETKLSAVALDFAYLLVLAQHYGLAGTFAAGDLNGDDKVDFADLLLLAQHYGKPLPD